MGIAAFIDGLVAVDIYSGGAVAGSIVSEGSVSAESLGEFFASVEAIGDVSVVSGGNVAAASGLSSVIRAGDEWSWSSVELFAEGDVSVTVDATGSVTIAAGGDVTKSVTAGEDADVEAGGRVSGAISAGGAAYVSATDDVSAPVVAWGDAYVWSQGSVTASVTSQAGEAELQVEGTVSGDVSADLDVWIDAGGNVAGTVTAGNDERWSNAFVRAGGNVTGAVSATWLAEVEAGGDVIGAVVAHGGDAVVTAGGDISGPVSSADGDVELWAWGGIEGNVLAEDAVLVVAFGTVTGGIDSESDEEELLSLGDDTAEAGPGHEAADPTGQMAASGWLDTLDRAGKVTTFLARQSAADQDALAGWWQGASARERANLLKELMQHAHSDGEMYTVLLTRIRPPEAEELPPPTPVRPPTTPPTPEELKQWEAEAKQAQKDRDAWAKGVLKEADDDDALRKKLSKGWLAQADRMRDARERGWIRRFFGAQHYAPPDRYGEESKLREWVWQAADKVNYEIKDGKVIGITEEGKRRQAVWDRVAKITAMSTTEKLKEVLRRVSEDNLLSQELRERVKELMQPANLALMGGAMAGLGAVAFTPWGPPVMGVVGGCSATCCWASRSSLRCYAVGQGGALAHNNPCDLPKAVPGAKAKGAAPDTPAFEAPTTPSGAETTAAGGANAKAATAPGKKEKRAAPSTEAATRSKSHRDRPRDPEHPRVKPEYRPVKDGEPTKRKYLSQSDEEVLATKITEYREARKKANLTKKVSAGEELGQAGAERYMEKQVGATKVYREQTPNGNFDLDLVYKKGDTYYVVEAKGGSQPRMSGRQVPDEIKPCGRSRRTR